MALAVFRLKRDRPLVQCDTFSETQVTFCRRQIIPMLRVPIMAALYLLGTPAMAQFNPVRIVIDLTQQGSQRASLVTATIPPACTLRTTQASVNVATLLPAIPVANVDTNAAQLVFSCNTPTAMLSIASSGALLSAATAPIGREATKFTTRVPFTARADLLGVAQTSGSSVWVMSDSAAVGPRNLAVGVGTGQRIRTVAVSARNINSGGLIPVAGAYTGSICVGVDPAGVIGTPQCDAPLVAPKVGGTPQ